MWFQDQPASALQVEHYATYVMGTPQVNFFFRVELPSILMFGIIVFGSFIGFLCGCIVVMGESTI